MKGLLKPKVLFVLGPPGSGKGTQSELISKEFKMFHISAGELLREEMNKELSEHKTLINDYMLSGRIVPVEITCSLIRKKIQMLMSLNNQYLYLIDGFPRNRNNYDGWVVSAGKEVECLGTLIIECNENKLLDRLKDRKRLDDGIDVFNKRMKGYNESTKEIYEDLRKLGPFIEVDGDKSVSDVFSDIKKKLRYLI